MIGFALSLVGKACRARYATEIYLGQVTMFYLLPPSGTVRRTIARASRFPRVIRVVSLNRRERLISSLKWDVLPGTQSRPRNYSWAVSPLFLKKSETMQGIRRLSPSRKGGLLHLSSHSRDLTWDSLTRLDQRTNILWQARFVRILGWKRRYSHSV